MLHTNTEWRALKKVLFLFCSFLHWSLEGSTARFGVLSVEYDELSEKRLGSTGHFHREMGHLCPSSECKRASPAQAEQSWDKAQQLVLAVLLTAAVQLPASSEFIYLKIHLLYTSKLENKEARCERVGQRYITFLGIIKQEGRNDQKIPNLNDSTGFYTRRIRDLKAGYSLLQSDKFKHKEI